MTRLDTYEWRYLRHGRVTHGFTDLSPDPHTSARCGISPVWFDWAGWLGTGNQAEYERAATLPRCRRCVTLLERGSTQTRPAVS